MKADFSIQRIGSELSLSDAVVPFVRRLWGDGRAFSKAKLSTMEHGHLKDG